MTMPTIIVATQITFDVFLKDNPRLRAACTSTTQTRQRVESRMRAVLTWNVPMLEQVWRVHAQNVDWDLLASMAQEKVRKHQK